MYRFLAKPSLGRRPLEVPRRPDFDLDIEAIGAAVAAGARIVFLTSPEQPDRQPCSTGTKLEALCALDALVVVDEAYIEFGGESVVPLIAKHPEPCCPAHVQQVGRARRAAGRLLRQPP